MRPYGGLSSGSPRTVTPAAAAFAAAARQAPRGCRRRVRRRPPAPEPPVRAHAGRRAMPWTKFMSEILTSGGGTRPSGLTPLCE